MLNLLKKLETIVNEECTLSEGESVSVKMLPNGDGKSIDGNIVKVILNTPEGLGESVTTKNLLSANPELVLKSIRYKIRYLNE